MEKGIGGVGVFSILGFNEFNTSVQRLISGTKVMSLLLSSPLSLTLKKKKRSQRHMISECSSPV